MRKHRDKPKLRPFCKIHYGTLQKCQGHERQRLKKCQRFEEIDRSDDAMWIGFWHREETLMEKTGKIQKLSVV